MKFKKVKVLALSATLVLALTACSKQENKDNMKSNPSSVEKVESNSNNSNKMDDNKAKIDELMKKQNDILASHDKQWQVAFSKADKSSAEDNKDKGYDAYLKDLVEKAKDELSKEDYELLTKDVEEIAKLEEEIMEMVNKTGIGPQLGGTTTCIGVNIEWGATHIAGLPVAVTIMCHAARHAHVVL